MHPGKKKKPRKSKGLCVARAALQKEMQTMSFRSQRVRTDLRTVCDLKKSEVRNYLL
jgi:hypothetical protein